MAKILLNELDFLVMQKHICEARMKNTIKIAEAEKLVNELKSALLLEPHEILSDVVTMNLVVKISFDGEGRQPEFRLFYSEKANAKA